MKQQPKKRYKKTAELTPAKQKFAQVYALTDNATEAARQAFPHLSRPGQDETNLSVKGHRLLRNDNVILSIAEQKAKIEELSSKALKRIEDLIDGDDTTEAGRNARWSYEQVHGKATVKVEQRSAHVEVIYNLGGSTSEPIPDDILKKIQAQS